MGLTYAPLKLTDLFNRQSVEVNALINTGATFMCVSEEVALQLGFDINEVSQQVVTLADGHQRKVPKLRLSRSGLIKLTGQVWIKLDSNITSIKT